MYKPISHASIGVLCAAVTVPIFGFLSVGAHEADQAGPLTHRQLTTTIEKVQSGIIFLKPVAGLQQRVVSLSKAERMGLLEAKPGDEVILTIDESNLLLDLHKKGTEPAGHRLITGTLRYADPFWEVIELSMPGGSQSFAVDIMAGSKLSVLSEGKVVRVELDEDNIVIDIHPSH
jgi:hypothetical protein